MEAERHAVSVIHTLLHISKKVHRLECSKSLHLSLARTEEEL